MVTKKIRTEYMKKFRDPRWETFSRCYEDSLRYRLTRRVMELSHKPWFADGWDSGSDSSGWSTPRLSRNRVAPLSLPLTHRPCDPVTRPGPPLPAGRGEASSGEDAGREDASIAAGDCQLIQRQTGTAVVVNGVTDGGGLAVASGPSEDTDSGPADTSSDGEPTNPAPRPRPRRRHNPRPDARGRDTPPENKPTAVRKPPRAKSQPPVSSLRASSRLDWTQRQTEARKTPGEGQTSEACVPPRRRARSADLEKAMRSQRLTAADDRWVTEYMRCFSARLR